MTAGLPPTPHAAPFVTRPLLLLAAGLAAGYAFGFRDAQTHDRTVIRRVAEDVLARAGGSARGKYNPDVDGEAERATAEPAPPR